MPVETGQAGQAGLLRGRNRLVPWVWQVERRKTVVDVMVRQKSILVESELRICTVGRIDDNPDMGLDSVHHISSFKGIISAMPRN